MDETQKLPPPVTARDILRILRRRAPIALFTFAVVVAVTLFLTSRMKPVYEARTSLILDGPTDTAAPSNILEFFSRNTGDSLETEMEKIRSRNFLLEVIRATKVAEMPPEELKGRLFLSTGRGGRILEIGVRAPTAEQAQLLANATAQVYKTLARVEYEEKVDLSEERLRNAQNKALIQKREAERQIKAFTARTGFADPARYFQRRAADVVDVKMGLEEARRTLATQRKSFRDLNEKLPRTPAEVTAGYSLNKNSVIDDYKRQLYELESERRKLLFDYAPDSDEVGDKDKQIADKKELLAKAEQERFSTGSRSISRNPDYSKIQSQIYETELAIKNSVTNIGIQEKRLAKLLAEQRDITSQQIAYESLLRKRSSADDAYHQAEQGRVKMAVTRVLSAPNIHTLEEAQLPPAPVSPKPVLNALMAVALGLFLGMGMALMAEYVASGSMVEEGDEHLPSVAGVPLLGTVPVALPAPTASGTTGLPAPLSPASNGYAEDALREIGYTLAHRHPRQPVPVVVLSGTRSDDTTATLAAQLTATLVRDGLRVTLVDADRHKPRLNHVFGAPDAPGLADVLAGRSRVQDILHVGVDGSLRFLAAGSPDDPTPMTEAGLRSVFRDLATDRTTDLVVVSGPSVWQAPLIAPLEKAAHGMVLIAPDGAPHESVARVRRLLSNGYKPRILGVVLGADSPTPALPVVATEAVQSAEEEGRPA